MDRSRVETPSSDPDRSYTDAESRQLADNLAVAAADVYEGHYRARHPDVALLCDLHSRVWGEVKHYAGRVREPGRGSEYLSFGPHRSVHRDRVRAELDTIMSELQRGIQACRESPDAPNYEEAAVRFAVKAHAELIRVHPFEDGNGRSTRLFLCSVLISLDLQPVEFEVCKVEYVNCLNHYMITKNLDYLVGLVLRMQHEAMLETDQ